MIKRTPERGFVKAALGSHKDFRTNKISINYCPKKNTVRVKGQGPYCKSNRGTPQSKARVKKRRNSYDERGVQKRKGVI